MTQNRQSLVSSSNGNNNINAALAAPRRRYFQRERPHHDNDNDDDDDTNNIPQAVLDLRKAAPKRISHVQFGLLSASDMERLAECPIHKRDLYSLGTGQRLPAVGR